MEIKHFLIVFITTIMCYGQESIISEEKSCRFRINHQAEILDDCTDLIKYASEDALAEEQIQNVDKIAQRLVYASDDIKKCTAPFLLQICNQNVNIPKYPLFLLALILRMDDTLGFSHISDLVLLNTAQKLFELYPQELKERPCLWSSILRKPKLFVEFTKKTVDVWLFHFIKLASKLSTSPDDTELLSKLLDEYLNHGTKPIVGLYDSAYIDNLPEHNQLVPMFEKDYALHATYYCKIVKDLLVLSCDKEMIQDNCEPQNPPTFKQKRNIYFNSEIFYIEINMNNGKEVLVHFVIKLKELKLFNPFIEMLEEFQRYNVMSSAKKFSDLLQTTSEIMDHSAILPVDICINILEFLL